MKAVGLQWNDIRYSVTLPGNENESFEILHGVTGCAKPGRLLAVMGPSGSGKSTLLNTLSGRVPANDYVEGYFRANGVPVDAMFPKRVCGYVQQDDLLFANMTVLETITFSARLRLPLGTPEHEIAVRVKSVIDELGLRKVANSKIGGELERGISGGERKRVSIALELVRDISVLILDEPSSGLDSFMAYNVVQTLHDLARNRNMTIICTLHQPRSQIWDLFDDLLVLSEGSVMYFGPASESMEFCRSLGYPCPVQFNPADHILDMVARDHRSKEADAQSALKIETFKKGYIKWQKSSGSVEQLQILNANSESPEVLYEESTLIPMQTQFKLLFIRAFNEIKRNKFATVIRTVSAIIFAILVGIIYLDLGVSQSSIQDRVGLLFFVIINASFGQLFGTINSFPPEKAVFCREYSSGFYSTLPYYLGKTIAELPFNIPANLTYIVILYPMAGLDTTATKMTIFALATFWVSWASEGLALMCSTTFKTVQSASAVAPSIMVIFILVGGLYANSDNLTPAIKWVEYISFISYGYRILMVNELTGLEFTCVDSELITDSDGILRCPLENGERVLESFSMDGASISEDFAALIGLTIAMRFIAYVFLRLSKPKVKLLK